MNRFRENTAAERTKMRILALSVAVLAMAPLVLLAQNQQRPSPGSEPTIKVDVNLVALHVTVTDNNGMPYRNLNAENFRILDNGSEQSIHHFTAEDLPFTVGLVLDRSGSMMPVIDEVYQAAFHTVRASKPSDEFFILTFNDGFDLRQDFSTDREQLKKRLKHVRAEGPTALYDAVLEALDHIQSASHDKKALVVVTDGDDNKSRRTFEELLERARRQQDVTIYVVGFFGWPEWAGTDNDGKSLRARLTELALATGGKAYFPLTMEECDRACIAIAEELRQQYSLGYYPRPFSHDGNWHTVRVDLQLPPDLSVNNLTARTRVGYFAPTDEKGPLGGKEK